MKEILEEINRMSIEEKFRLAHLLLDAIEKDGESGANGTASRRSEAKSAIRALREASSGELSAEEIDAEIAAARRERRKVKEAGPQCGTKDN